MIETHAHLDFPEYDKDRDEVVARAKESGINAIINVGSNLEGSVACVDLAKKYSMIYAACGIHPHDAKSADSRAVDDIRGLAVSENKVVAIGEIGIDLYRNLSPEDIQRNVFYNFLKISKELDLPVIIHCREEAPDRHEASDMLFQVMEEALDIPYKGVMHCFSGGGKLLRRCLDAGLYISYTCNITYKKADKLRDALKKTPLERLLLETDSPFLSPQEKRGTRNEPSHLKYLLKAISEYTGLPEQEIEGQTDVNADELFFKKSRHVKYEI
jgi:TatD DNase family protein